MAADPRARITETEHKVGELERRLESIRNGQSGNQNVTLVAFSGGKGVLIGTMVGLVGGVCLGVSVVVAMWVASVINRQDLTNHWTAQEITAVRSYITNGKLAPMKPRPFAEPTPQPEKP